MTHHPWQRYSSNLLALFCTFLIIIALIIMGSWWLKLPAPILFFSSSFNIISFNTALCLFSSALSILLANFLMAGDRTCKIQLMLGLGLIAFSSLNLIDNIENYQLGINQLVSTAWMDRSYLAPAGMTFAGSSIFILVGLAITFLAFPLQKKTYGLTLIISFLIFTLGVISVLGHLLKLDFIFEWYEFTRLSFFVSVSLILLSINLWILISFKEPYHLSQGREVQFIHVWGFSILVIVGLSSAVTGFTLLLHQYENFVKGTLETSLYNRSEFFKKSIKIIVDEMDTILLNQDFTQAVKDKNATTLKNLGSIVGFAYFEIKDPHGSTLFLQGHPAKDSTHKLQLITENVTLFWEKDIVLTMSKPIMFDGKKIGILTIQEPLPIISSWFLTTGPANLLLCHFSIKQSAECLSSTSYPHLERYGRESPEIVPIGQALAGKTGAFNFIENKNFIYSLYRPIGNYDLGLVYKVNMSNVFKPTAAQLVNMSIIILSTIFIGAFLLYWQVMPLVKTIVNSEKRAKLREHQLSMSEAYTRGIIENIGEGLIIIDEKGNIESFNSKACEIFGYSPQEVINKNITLLMPPYYRERHLAGMARYLATGKAHMVNKGAVQVEGLHKNGHIIPLDITINEIIFQDHRIFTGVVRDVSQRKKIEEDQALLSAIIASSNDAIIGVYISGSIFCWNKAAEILYGYSAMEIIGKHIATIIPEHKKAELSYIHSQIIQGDFLHIETERLHKNGSLIPVSVTISPIKDKDGKIIGKSAIARNISERKQIERMKNEFISVVSHELRTPLTSIHGSVSLLVGGIVSDLPQKAIKLLEIAKQNTELLIRLINDILDIEKIEAGKLEFHFEPIDMGNLINEALTINQAFADKFSIKMEVNQTFPNIKVMADHDRLLQVLNNLLSNAIKFSPTKSTITVSMLVLPDNKIRVAIADQGQGIPKKFQANIFEKFAQADSTATRKHQGTGLGLSISKAIIDKFNGHIGFNTKTNDGTTFYFDLPIYNELLNKTIFKKSTTILLCEHDKNFANLLSTILEQQDFQVITVSSVEEAKKELQTRVIDALLLDLIIPDQDGISFIKELRKSPSTAFLPVIVLSVQAQSGKTELQGNAFSVLDWIERPIDFERFIQTMSLLERHIHKETPHILHIEDDNDLAQVVANAVHKDAAITTVANLKLAIKELEENHYDLVILDLMLPDGSGLDLFPLLSQKRIPTIIFSAYELPKEYAHYVHSSLLKTKTSLDALLKTIRTTIELQRNRNLTYATNTQ